jgi:hypothetical protein
MQVAVVNHASKLGCALLGDEHSEARDRGLALTNLAVAKKLVLRVAKAGDTRMSPFLLYDDRFSPRYGY